MTKTTRQTLYRLLHDALIEMRMRGYERGDKGVFALGDIFHNVPLQLNRLDNGELSVEDIMRDIEARARRRDSEGWIEFRMSEIAKYHPEALAQDDGEG